MDKRHKLGRLGERRAARLLRRHGVRILERNWRCTIGEVDIIARDGITTVFVEVRSSARGYAGGPLYTVGARKQRKLITLAETWLRTHPMHRGSVRFDVIGVTKIAWNRYELDWVKNAFVA